jgi:hypothetical protein
MQVDPLRTAVVASDMHRGHLHPTVATLPLPTERSPGVIVAAQVVSCLARASPCGCNLRNQEL